MPNPNLTNEPCDCPPGECRNSPDMPHPDWCINRLKGDVRTLECTACKSFTWHQDGNCLRCRKIDEMLGIAKPTSH